MAVTRIEQISLTFETQGDLPAVGGVIYSQNYEWNFQLNDVLEESWSRCAERND